MVRIRDFRRPILFAFATLVAVGVSTAEAQIPDPWTTVGAAGSVDEADTGLVLLGSPGSGAVTMRPTLLGTVRIRYNVVAVGGLVRGAGLLGLALTSRFLDRGPTERVFVRLREYGLTSGLIRTLLTLDSNDYPGIPAWQVQTTADCSANMDFSGNGYFIEVELTKTPLGLFLTPPFGRPALGIVKLEPACGPQ